MYIPYLYSCHGEPLGASHVNRGPRMCCRMSSNNWHGNNTVNLKFPILLLQFNYVVASVMAVMADIGKHAT